MTILAVDDDANYLTLIEHACSADIKNQFQSATGGEGAIEYLKGNGEYSDRSRFPVPALIITDLRMARGDGFWLLKQLKRNPKWLGIRSVVLSGSSYPEDIKKAYELGACAYHLKPGVHEDLLKLLKTMFDYWLTSEVTPAVIAGQQIETGITPQPCQESGQPGYR